MHSDNASTQSSSTTFILRDPQKKRKSRFIAFFGISIRNEKNKLSTKKDEKQDIIKSFYQPPLVRTTPSIESSHVQCILREHGSRRFTFSFQNPFRPNEEWPALMSQVDHHTTHIFDMTGYNSFPNQSICTNDIRCIGTLRQQSDGGNGHHASLYDAHGFHGVLHEIASIRIYGKSRLLMRKANIFLHDEKKVLVAKNVNSKSNTTFGLQVQHGRGKCAPKKSCILMDERKCLVFQMTKVGTETFHVEYRAPLTAYAAFGFALAHMGVA